MKAERHGAHSRILQIDHGTDEVIPGIHEGEYADRQQRGLAQRQDDPGIDREIGCSVEYGCFIVIPGQR